MLSNPFYKDVVKIGYTCGVVEQRARELATTGVPAKFVVEYFKLTVDVEKVEAAIHEALGNRVSSDREFFAVDVSVAVETIERIAQQPSTQYRRAVDQPQSATTGSLRKCRRCGHQYPRVRGGGLCPKCGF